MSRDPSQPDALERPPRPMAVWSALLALAVALGIGSRRFAAALPQLVAAHAGDTLWALAAFLGMGLIFRRRSTGFVAAAALGFAVLIETSQLYHAPWIDAIRRLPLAALVLGWGFLWCDLARYVAGVALGAALEWGIRRRFSRGPVSRRETGF